MFDIKIIKCQDYFYPHKKTHYKLFLTHDVEGCYYQNHIYRLLKISKDKCTKIFKRNNSIFLRGEGIVFHTLNDALHCKQDLEPYLVASILLGHLTLDKWENIIEYNKMWNLEERDVVG